MERSQNALFVLLSACLLATVPAHAGIIDFDETDASAGDVVLSPITPYQGYVWNNVSIYTGTPGFPGFNNGIVSGFNAAYTSGDAFGSPIVSSISSQNPFNFLGGYFGSGWYDGLSVTVNGIYDGSQNFSQTFTVNTTGAQYFAFDFLGINELDIYSTTTASTADPYGCGPSGCSQVTIDNLALTPAVVSSTPEPTGFLLAVIGVFVLAALSRLRSRHTLS